MTVNRRLETRQRERGGLPRPLPGAPCACSVWEQGKRVGWRWLSGYLRRRSGRVTASAGISRTAAVARRQKPGTWWSGSREAGVPDSSSQRYPGHAVASTPEKGEGPDGGLARMTGISVRPLGNVTARRGLRGTRYWVTVAVQGRARSLTSTSSARAQTRVMTDMLWAKTSKRLLFVAIVRALDRHICSCNEHEAELWREQEPRSTQPQAPPK